MKTLKDIEESEQVGGEYNLWKPSVNPVELRQVAREWIDEYERLDVIAKKEINASVHWGTIIFIKHFFNLEDDFRIDYDGGTV